MNCAGELIYDLFCQRLQAGWMVGFEGNLAIELADLIQSHSDHILINTHDPVEFIASFMAGCRWGIPIFLGNPLWGAVEWEQVSRIIAQVDSPGGRLRQRQQHQNTIMIPTGGSSGEIKFAIHTWETLSASVWGFQEFYEIDKINVICTLPLYHVSGLMQLVRSILTDGKFLIVNFHQLCNHLNLVTSEIKSDNYFISLVPTQLAKLLDLDPNWLRQFKTILLGGAPASSELLNRARIARLPLALTYGMTETAAQITSLKPEEFWAGNTTSGRVLPHAQIELISVGDSQLTSIQIKSKSLFLGYFPNLDLPSYFEPDDIGILDSDGYLTILGRNSDKIITGGENVFPIEVVNAIMATGLVDDAWVLGLPDRYWGQTVAAIYVPNSKVVSPEILARAIIGKISKYKVPKYWFPVAQIPRNSIGKVLINEVELLVKARFP